MSQFKQCSHCKQEKPVSEFYPRSGSPHVYNSWCKVCMNEKSRSTPHKQQPFVSTVPSERAILDVLAHQGIPAITGKALGVSWCDVVCFGCIGVEVKQSPLRGGMFTFPFTPSQQMRLKADVILLICDYGTHQTHHLFTASDEVFYKRGKLKTAICYNPSLDKHKGKFGTLTTEHMKASQNAWYVIVEGLRQRQNQLMTTGYSIPEWA